MGIEIIRIDEQNKKIKIKSLPEDSYLKIDVKRWTDDGSLVQDYFSVVSYTVNYTNGKADKDKFVFGEKNPQRTLMKTISTTNDEIESVYLELTENSINDFYVELEIQKGRDLIDIKNPITNFRNFITARVNSRILFSGAFGQGKTTFLNFFFDEVHKNDYTVFRVFPVNYSVSSNEDVFRYIKSDILFQLLGRDIDFDKQEINLLESFQEYAYLNPRKTIISFLKNVSRLNSKTEILSKSIDALNDFMTPILEYHQEQQVDDKQKAKSYIQEIYEKEGSLFEDNFYTQLIRQLLEQIKKKTEKPTVLIIEDLDRMDPDHIFRILNVISAHYDASNENVEIHNKFGFDKIILVCDINNIRNIFSHKYGIRTDFEGYINKYYSSAPYYFNNCDSISLFIEEHLQKIHTNIPSNKKYSLLLQILYTEDQFSLREILKLTLHDYRQFRSNVDLYYLRRGPYTKPLEFLCQVYTPEVLIQKFESIKIKVLKRQRISYDEESAFLIGALCERKEKNETVYNNLRCRFKYQEHFHESTFSTIEITEKIKVGGIEIVMTPFTEIDFYNLLIENVKRIKESIDYY